jgi:hypothetical protein
METNYPTPVIEWVDSIYDVLLADGFFADFGIDETLGKQALVDLIGPAGFAQWIESGHPTCTEEEMEKALGQLPIYTALIGLQNRGLIDSMQNESGEDVFFLTETGKDVQKFLQEAES